MRGTTKPAFACSFSTFPWAMNLSSHLILSPLCVFSQAATISSQAATISSQARLVSNDTSHQYIWISNGMSNSLPSEWHSDCRSIQRSSAYKNEQIS